MAILLSIRYQRQPGLSGKSSMRPWIISPLCLTDRLNSKQPDRQAVVVGVIVVSADPDVSLAQGHATNGAVHSGDTLKQIVDVTVDHFCADHSSTAVFLVGQALAFIEFYVFVVDGHPWFRDCLLLIVRHLIVRH